MKVKVLTKINVLIAVTLGVLGFSGCEARVKYGVPVDGVNIDTTMHPMYGVTVPVIDDQDEE